MGKKLSKAELYARAEAYSSAAEHLILGWTEDPTEMAEGIKLSNIFFSKAGELNNLADMMDD